MGQTVYQVCCQQASAVFAQHIDGFQQKSVVISRCWDVHVTYIMHQKKQEISVEVLPEEVERLWVEGIYVNIRFSGAYLLSFLRDAFEKTIPFSISANYTEEEIFSLPLYTACRLNDVSNFLSWSGFSEKNLADILWRVYAFDGILNTSKIQYVDFFCKITQEILDQESLENIAQNQKKNSTIVARFAAQRLQEILLETKQ